MTSTVFLDRDGVINRNRGDHVKSWDEFEFLPQSLKALRRLAELGHRVVVVTNQSVIDRGIVSRETVEEINRRMDQVVEANGGRIDAVFYCPHRPDEECECRKPKPGLLYKARDELGIDLSTAIMVGDQASDIQAAERAGCRAAIQVLGVRHGSDQDSPVIIGNGYAYTARDLFAAVELIRSIGVASRMPAGEVRFVGEERSNAE